MRVFLSWSQNSLSIAKALHDWLPLILQPLDPWLSEEDIAKGSRSLQELDKALGSTIAGIICVTQANQTSPWLAYEAGFLARNVEASRVTAFLVDMAPTDLRGPLAYLQATRATREDLYRLVKAFNDALGEGNRVPEERWKRQFDDRWPDLEKRLSSLELGENVHPPKPPPIEEILHGLLATTRQTHTGVERVSAKLDEYAPSRRILPSHSILTETSSGGTTSAELSFGSRDSIPSLSERLSRSSRLWMLGQSLEHMTSSEFGVLQSFVGNGGELRAMMLDPRDKSLI